jgi:hypothetical protein
LPVSATILVSSGGGAARLGTIVTKGKLEAVIEAGAQETLEAVLDGEGLLNRQNARATLEEIKTRKYA